ncbi:MAG: type II toxin-antitoxin system VapC family toxin [Gemmatimonadota bacterium]|nr:type II toxin-antitoxin system VapC family toxin [Gemmatimonadota bacterium]
MLTLDANVWVAAFDPRDRFHARSAAFLRAVALKGIGLHGPAFVTLEVACALARRAGDSAVGAIVHERLRAHPALALHPLDDRLLEIARELGVDRLLRAGDALYAATAKLLDAPLVSWDDELVQRAEALTPDTWLAAHA